MQISMLLLKNSVLKAKWKTIESQLKHIHAHVLIKTWNMTEQFLLYGRDFRRIKSEFVETGGEGL